MFLQFAERQSDVVNALLDGIGREDWVRACLHAEFGEGDAPVAQLRRGFLVVDGPAGRTRAMLPLEPPVGDALDAMHACYAQADHRFSRLELVLERDGRYRFELADTPSAILAGKLDPEAKSRLDRRFDELSAQ